MQCNIVQYISFKVQYLKLTLSKLPSAPSVFPRKKTSSIHHCQYTASVFGLEEGYIVKYTPEGVPKGTPEGKGVYLTLYPKSSPNTDSISF